MHDAKFALLPAYSQKDLAAALVSLSVASGVVCSKTAFVAVNPNQKSSAECTCVGVCVLCALFSLGLVCVCQALTKYC